jgi:hypothetical protein
MVNKLGVNLGAKSVTETESGHNIYLYNPQFVIDSIEELVARGAALVPAPSDSGVLDICSRARSAERARGGAPVGLSVVWRRVQLCSVRVLKIYLAGPLFTPYERSFIDECAAALRADGIEVFVPHEHELATGVDVSAAWIFAKDRPGIERADAMLAILDGPSVDDGTACEIGMFHALMQSDPSKKGIVGLLTDIRGMRGESRGVNLFVEGAIEDVGRIVTSIEEAREVLSAWR